MSMKVLISAPYIIPVIDRFRPVFDENDIEIVVAAVRECLEEDELLQYVSDIDGAICGDDSFTERVLKAAPKLKVVSKWGTGIDSIDQSACQRLGIQIFRTPNAFSEPLADTVMGYILCFARQLPWADQEVKSHRWKKMPSRALNECILGIIGVGNCGKAVARRAKAFDIRLMGNDIKEIPPDFIEETGISMVSKTELLEQADFVSINCDLNPTSYHLISHNQLAKMKSDTVLINTARGPIIDEEALVSALEHNQIGGAALDVFEVEPLPDGSPLRRMPNVMLAPHNANSSPTAWEKVHWNTVNNLIRGLKREAQ